MNNDAAREWYRIATAQFGMSNAPHGYVAEDDPIYMIADSDDPSDVDLGLVNVIGGLALRVPEGYGIPEGYEVGPPAIDIDPLLAEAEARHIYGTLRGGL